MGSGLGSQAASDLPDCMFVKEWHFGALLAAAAQRLCNVAPL